MSEETKTNGALGDEELRVKLLTFAGWKLVDKLPDERITWLVKDKLFTLRQLEDHPANDWVPNPVESLDAVHDAEKRLDDISNPISMEPQPNRIYMYILSEIVCERPLWLNGTFIGSPFDLLRTCRATARQRCLALARTIDQMEGRG